jgi:hypothetical protein
VTSKDEHKTTSIVVDHYRIVVSDEDDRLGEQKPKSWSEVATQVNGHLMRMAAGATRLIAETIESATRLVRGISVLPSSVSRRIEQTHSAADDKEGREQDRLLSSGLPSVENGLKLLNDVLKKYKTLGFTAEVRIATDGKPVIVLLPPGGQNVLADAEESRADASK